MTQTCPATCVLGPGLTGLAIGLRVLNLDGTVYAAFATTGVAETSVLGTYRKAAGVVCPDAGAYIVWGTAVTDYAEATVESTSANVTYWSGVAAGAAPATVADLPAEPLDAAGVRSAVGLASANLDTQLAAIPTVGEIDTQLSTTHGDGSWEAVGTGATTQVYTVYQVDGTTPESGVVVRMTTDAAGLVLIDQQISDAAGQVSLKHDLTGGTTVYLWRYKAGVTYSDPDTEVIP